MARKYKLRLREEYNISENRYAELSAFCQQYDEKKAELKELYMLSSVSTEATVMGGVPGKPTEKKATRAARLKNDIDVIDRCLSEACAGAAGLIEPLKRNVTRKIGYDSLGYVPCSSRTFYKCRRKFFFLLDEAKK